MGFLFAKGSSSMQIFVQGSSNRAPLDKIRFYTERCHRDPRGPSTEMSPQIFRRLRTRRRRFAVDLNKLKIEDLDNLKEKVRDNRLGKLKNFLPALRLDETNPAGLARPGGTPE